MKIRKKRETSKLLAYWAAAIATVCPIISYTLAACDKDAVSSLTEVIFGACIGYLITYAGKSLGEKMSRNKYGLDEDGKPYQRDPLDEEEQDNDI